MPKIIDFEKRGNVVRFFLGKDDLKEWHGDDWDDRPYEHNAGNVYDEFVSGWFDVAWDTDHYVLEPADGAYNSVYCKDDMKNQDVPCIVIAKPQGDDCWDDRRFTRYVASANAERVYFGDKVGIIRTGGIFHGGVILLVNKQADGKDG